MRGMWGEGHVAQCQCRLYRVRDQASARYHTHRASGLKALRRSGCGSAERKRPSVVIRLALRDT